MTENKARKKAIRERMRQTGEPYSVAARKLDAHRRAFVFQARAELDSDTGWRIEIDGHPPDKDPITTHSWPVGIAMDHRSTAIEQLDQALEAEGWQRTPACWWPPEDPVPHTITLEVERSPAGRRVDEVKGILDEAGLHFHSAHGPYITAVAKEIQAAGIAVADWWADADEPRGGAIELAGQVDGYEEVYVCWREDRGWFYVPHRAGEAFGEFADDLPGGLPRVPLPGRVATAVADLLDHQAQQPATTSEWAAPTEYEEDPDYIDEPRWDVSPDLERSLTAYITHPANLGRTE